MKIQKYILSFECDADEDDNDFYSVAEDIMQELLCCWHYLYMNNCELKAYDKNDKEIGYKKLWD